MTYTIDDEYRIEVDDSIYTFKGLWMYYFNERDVLLNTDSFNMLDLDLHNQSIEIYVYLSKNNDYIIYLKTYNTSILKKILPPLFPNDINYVKILNLKEINKIVLKEFKKINITNQHRDILYRDYLRCTKQTEYSAFIKHEYL